VSTVCDMPTRAAPLRPAPSTRPRSAGSDGSDQGGPPSFRRASYVTSSRDHATPDAELHRRKVGGIKPAYMGFVPKAQFQYGVSTVGGIHADATGSATDYKMHFNQSNECWHGQDRGAAPADRARIPGYQGHMVNSNSLGASAYAGSRLVVSTDTEHDRLRLASEQTWSRHAAPAAPLAASGVPGYTGHVRGKRDTVGAGHARPVEESLSA